MNQCLKSALSKKWRSAHYSNLVWIGNIWIPWIPALVGCKLVFLLGTEDRKGRWKDSLDFPCQSAKVQYFSGRTNWRGSRTHRMCSSQHRSQYWTGAEWDFYNYTITIFLGWHNWPSVSILSGRIFSLYKKSFANTSSNYTFLAGFCFWYHNPSLHKGICHIIHNHM